MANAKEILDELNADPIDAQIPATPPPGMVPVSMLADFGKILADSIVAGMAQQAGPKKVTFGQYDPRSPWHPDKKKRVKLTRVVFQNGNLVNPDMVLDADIVRLNKINRSGRYLNRKVEVSMREDVDAEVIYISYKTQTLDQRMENKTLFVDFSDLLKKILMEQEIAEENEQLRAS